jgi:hypothetical protein
VKRQTTCCKIGLADQFGAEGNDYSLGGKLVYNRNLAAD